MNPEYLVLGGLLWRLWRKKTVLWYTHKNVDLKLRVATALADEIATASKESFRLRSRKVHVVGHGIDTDFFAPGEPGKRGSAVLSVGRLSKSKRHDLAIEAAALAGRELRIIGDGPERKNLELLAQKLHASVRFLGGLGQAALREEYRTAAYLIHTSETGSMDKVVLEALACGLPVVSTSEVYKTLPVRIVPATPQDVAAALDLPGEAGGAAAVRAQYSLPALISRVLALYRT